MAGTFTHFITCDVAKRKRSIIGADLSKFLNKYSEFLFIGAVSPDLPYLSFRTGNVNWADAMHYEKTNSIVVSAHRALKNVWPLHNPADEVKFVWLMGYASHLVADATIHPIVQAIVGPYDEVNKEEHRICEMTQDSLIFSEKENKNTDISYAEFSSILSLCGQSKHFDELMEFWKGQIIQNYPDKHEEPQPSLWFKTYTKAIDAAEGGSDVVALFRHTGIGTGYIYKSREEILSKYYPQYKKYYEEVKLPNGTVGSFKEDGFEKAVTNVLSAWVSLYTGLTSDLVISDFIKNWNLDKGVDMDSPREEVTYWV